MYIERSIYEIFLDENSVIIFIQDFNYVKQQVKSSIAFFISAILLIKKIKKFTH